jgi:Dullard-like phosphatase family protein
MKGKGSGKFFKREAEIIQEIQSADRPEAALKVEVSKKFSEEAEQVNLDEFFGMASINSVNCQNVEPSSHPVESDESDSSESSDESHSTMYQTLLTKDADEKKKMRERQISEIFAGIELDYVESSLNYQGNYQNYVSSVLKSLMALRSVNFSELVSDKNILLPECEGEKKTLILDLDETLIHADFDGNWSEHDHTVTFLYEGHEVRVPIILRPGLFTFLEKIAEIFEIFIFTASKKEYADAILNYLDPENKIFKNRFYREHCINVKNRVFIKDLRMFGNRKPENLIILDNSLYSFSNQLSNGILINSFYNDKDDRELFNVYNYLEQYLQNAPDSRAVNEQIFSFNLILQEYSKQVSEMAV